MSYEYQNKRVRKFAIRKGLILKDMPFRDQNGSGEERAGRKKSGSKLPHSQTQLSTRISIVQIKELSRAIFALCVP
jgi:hypothetical protein